MVAHMPNEGVRQPGLPSFPTLCTFIVERLLEPIDLLLHDGLQKDLPLATQMMLDLVASHTSLARLMTSLPASTSIMYYFSAQNSKPSALLPPVL